ncbi:hypothetical protein ABM012_00225 [Morganella morganii]|uniref:hypothetical protein n=1 Tax=Morganella morganii TaxID=582 RepID=UPI003EB6DC26
MKIEIPDSYDPDWQCEQLRIISNQLEKLDRDVGQMDMPFESKVTVRNCLEPIHERIEALRDYSGH